MSHTQKQDQWEQIVTEILSHQRHDWLNHLQILSSYLKLGRYEALDHYIENLSHDMVRESHVAQLGYPPLVVYLLSYNALHPELKLEVELPVPMKLVSSSLAEKTHKWIEEIMEGYRSHAGTEGEANHLLLSIEKREQHLFFSFQFTGSLKEGWQSSLEALIREVKQQGGHVCRNWQGSQEYIFEFETAIEANEVHVDVCR